MLQAVIELKENVFKTGGQPIEVQSYIALVVAAKERRL